MEKEMFIKAVLKVQAELKAPKNQYNDFGKYKYRSAESILESVKPLLAKTELVLLVKDEIVQIGDRFYVKAVATLTDGEHELSSQAYAREDLSKKGMDGSQVTGASSSYARKYALNGLLCIDDGKDADSLNNNKEYTDEFEIAKPEVEGCKSIQYLGQIWSNYKSLQSDARFIKLVTDRKTELQSVDL